MTPAPHTPWLTIVGIGEDGWPGLSPQARHAVESAQLLYGGARHLAHIPASVAQPTRIPWPSPMLPAIQQLLQQRGQRTIAVLASGDPMLYGVGVTLTRHLDPAEYRIHPQPSAFSLACARLGWPLAETTLVSLVHRPLAQLHRHLAPGQRLVVYSEDGTTPSAVAQLLTASGYGATPLDLFENLGGPSERHTAATAATWPTAPCGSLNLIALRCLPDASLQPLSVAPGLPDTAFHTDGQLTKREVRAATLAHLAPLPGQLLWDVGAGTGTIAIEWMRLHPSCTAIAFETRPDRAATIAANATRLGVPALTVVHGSAPDAFTGQPTPDAIFLGGGISQPGLFESCWQHLPTGGRLVANAVTLSGEARLATLHETHGGDLVRIHVAHAERIGATYAWRQRMPITQWAVRKP